MSEGESWEERRVASEEEKARARDMAVQTMVRIYNGGIRDVVGGGFSRYSVDERWHVPHCKSSSTSIEVLD